MTEAPKRTRLLALLALVATALPPACRDAPPSREAHSPETAVSAAASLPAARYVTLVAWTASGGRPAGLLWMENSTGDSVALGRRYRGWTVEGETVRSALRVDDRLPVPAAAWRPLPAPGLKLSVDARGRISSLSVGGSGTRLRLGRQLSSWRGGTGQEQRLRRGTLRTEGDTARTPVTVAVLRFEHLAGDPGPVGPSRTLLAADGGGRGLLALDEESRRAWSRAWSWDAEGAVRRLDAAALPDSAGAGETWSFRAPPEGGLPVEWRIAAPEAAAGGAGGEATGSAAGSAPGELRLVPVSARLLEGEAGRPARGVLLRARPVTAR